MRKLMIRAGATFPAPVRDGKPAIWHLSQILAWMTKTGKYEINEALIDVTKTNMMYNVCHSKPRSRSSISTKNYPTDSGVTGTVPTPTRYRDRQTGSIVVEHVPGQSLLHWFYTTSTGHLVFRAVFNRPLFSRLYGWWKQSTWTRRQIRPFAERYRIDLDEIEHPLSHYSSFNDFFIRRLKPGARPCDPDPERLCCPSRWQSPRLSADRSRRRVTDQKQPTLGPRTPSRDNRPHPIPTAVLLSSSASPPTTITASTSQPTAKSVKPSGSTAPITQSTPSPAPACPTFSTATGAPSAN